MSAILCLNAGSSSLEFARFDARLRAALRSSG